MYGWALFGVRRGRPCGVPARPLGAIENAHAFSYEATEAVLDFDMGDREGRPYGPSPTPPVDSRICSMQRQRSLAHSSATASNSKAAAMSAFV